MGDILSSISILVGILTALYAMFYPEIQSFLDVEPNKQKANNKADHKKGKNILFTKVFPLTIGSLCLTLVFIPELGTQVKNAVNVYNFNNHELHLADYNTVSAAYIVVSVFSILLTVSVIVMAIHFFVHLAKFNPN